MSWFQPGLWKKQAVEVQKAIWPISWSKLQKPTLITNSLKQAPHKLKIIFIICCVGSVVSTTFLVFGIYLSLSSKTAANGGTVYEAISGDTLKVFNPVLALNPSEEKVAKLLFLPLYFVEHPDYLKNPTAVATIEPVLLTGEPQWMDSENQNVNDRFRILRFTLKSDLKWSDNTPITRADVKYTFERLKEADSNPLYNSLFKDVTFVEMQDDAISFELQSAIPQPRLKYTANFQPISQEFYNAQTTAQLLSDPKSFRVDKTSGWFKVKSGKVMSPQSQENVDNPQFNPDDKSFKVVGLNKNTVTNYGKGAYIDEYIFSRFTSIEDQGGDVESIERSAKDAKVDYFSRFMGSSLGLSSQEVSKNLELEQKVVPTNTYYSLFLNTKVKSFLINQSLRKYIVCSFVDWNSTAVAQNNVTNIERNRRIAPFILGDIAPECPAIPSQALDPEFYKLVEKDRGIRRVLLNNAEISLKLLGFPDSQPLLTEVQTYLKDIGLPANLVEFAQVNESLSQKNYDIALLPISMETADPYPIFGSRGQDLNVLRLNSRIREYAIEDNLSAFSRSNLTNTVARDNVARFFKEQFVVVNLFQNNQEINYSKRLNKGSAALWPDFYHGDWVMYRHVPEWFVETSRRLR
jgi:hypothetical protein